VNDQISANRRKALLVVARFFAVVFAVFFVIALLLGGGWLLFAVPLVAAAVVSLVAYLNSEPIALRRVRAVPADEVEYARYHNIVEGLCIASGIPRPRLFVVDDPAPNAFAIGRSPKHAAIVSTSGLLDKLSRVELEGVIAHELSHIRNLDILPMTLAVTMSPVPALRRGFAPLEYTADASGVAMTRYPPGLIAALKKIDDDGAAMRAPSKATAPLWISDPVAHSPLTDRIHALEGM
jgi:heat shock protein HtpX